MSTLQTTNLKHPDSASTQVVFSSGGDTAVSGSTTFSSPIKASKLENASTTNGGVEIDADGHVQLDGQQFPTAGPLSNRNLIINGAMQVAQRSTSETGVNGSAIHTVDRMFYSETNSNDFVFTQERSTDAPPGFRYSLKLTTTTADTSLGSNTEMRGLRYKIEGQDLMHLNYGTANAQPITLSFWVKTSVAGTYAVRFVNNASSSKRYVENYTIAPGEVDTWQYRTVTVNGDTTAGIDNTDTSELEIFFVIAAGSGRLGGSTGQWDVFTSSIASSGHTANVVGTVDATWQATGLQLEVGSKATSFEHKSYAQYLIECQRYFQKLTAPAANTRMAISGNGSISSSFPTAFLRTTMRANPSIDFSALGDFDIEGLTGGTKSTPTAINANAGGPDSVTVAVGVSGGSSSLVGTNLLSKNSNCFLSFNAEL